jgi:cytohesin
LLVCAIEARNLPALNALLELGEDPNQKDTAGNSLLHWAIVDGVPCKFIEPLLRHGADIFIENSRSSSLLASAAAHGRVKVVEKMLAYNPKAVPVQPGDPAAPESTASSRLGGRPPLSPIRAAIQGRHVGVVRTLLKAGWPANPSQQGERSALHIAAENGHAAAVGVLSQYGAHIDLPNSRGDTPLLHLCRILPTSAYRGLSSAQIGATIEALAKHGANIDAIPTQSSEAGSQSGNAQQSGRTPLHWAISHRHSVAVKTLIRLGASVEIEDGNGHTPLQLVVPNAPIAETVANALAAAGRPMAV